MATNPNQIGGLNFTPLIDAVKNFTDTLRTVVTRLTTVAPAAGGTDPAASAAAQAEIQQIADQITQAIVPLNAALNAATTAAANATPPPASPATPAPVETAGNVPPAGSTPTP